MHICIPYIVGEISEKIISVTPVSGGNISAEYRIDTVAGRYFLKVNSASFAPEMFRAERDGLQAIRETGTVAVPRVHRADTVEGHSFLLMDFVESKRPDESDYQRLGTQLAELHRYKQSGSGIKFGFPSDNFIGRLPQSNRSHSDWAEFYWHERIFSQLQRAHGAGLIQSQMIPDGGKAIALFRNTFGEVKPSLLHGDLWGGNYLISTRGTPCLIDPAVYYGHCMVDIAMSHLFGGFGTDFYDAYHRVIPKPDHYDAQIELYQLYYLLVHLNLFGSGYYSPVASILRRYF
jgi:fructosamine-3-kinase